MTADFIDSNVLLYLFDETDARKREIARDIVRRGLEHADCAISHQVVQETLNVLSTKLRIPLTHEDTLRFLDNVLVPLWKVMPSQRLYQRGLEVRARYQFSSYDSLIIAAALEGGCARLLSEDLHDGQRIDTLTIVNPFSASAL